MDPVSYVLAAGDEEAGTALVRPNQASSLIAFFLSIIEVCTRTEAYLLVLSYTAISVGLGLSN
jgi:hypothetical protein